MKPKRKEKKVKAVLPDTDHQKSNWFPYLFIVIVSFILYGNTTGYDYALDDLIVVQQNSFTKEGFSGISDILTNDNFAGAFGKDFKHLPGARYRPLSLVTFAFENQFWGLNPHVSHFFNVLLYALTGLLLFKVVSKLLRPDATETWYLTTPFITAILFITHPIHTEVIANIKGRDEILALLLSLAALYYSIRYSDTQKKGYLIPVFITFFLALLSKENAIVFAALIPLALYFFRNAPLKKNYPVLVPVLMAAVLFLLIRQAVVGSVKTGAEEDLLNNPFLFATQPQKYATIFYTLGLYIKLLIFPHPLTYDYYPYHIPLINPYSLKAIIPFITYMALVVVAVAGLLKKNIYSFAILVFLIPLLPVSNLLFNVGVFMGERFIYISSIGFCLAFAFATSHFLTKRNLQPAYALMGLFVIVGLYSFKTANRSRAWESNTSLLMTDVKTSPESAKSNFDAGHLMEQIGDSVSDVHQKKLYYSMAMNYAQKAYSIYPDIPDNLMTIANLYHKYRKNYDSILFYYKVILRRSPEDDRVYNNIHYYFQGDTNADYQIKTWKSLYHYRPDNFYINNDLGFLYGKYKQNFDSAIFYMEKAVMSPTRGNNITFNKAHAYNDLGVFWLMKEDYVKARESYLKAVEIMPDNPDFLNNLGTAYNKSGDAAKAQECFEKAQRLMHKNN